MIEYADERRWGAISRGAVLKGLNATTGTEAVTKIISRSSYGFRHSSHYNPDIHHRFEETFICPYEGVKMVRDQMKWYLERVSHLLTWRCVCIERSKLIFVIRDRA